MEPKVHSPVEQNAVAPHRDWRTNAAAETHLSVRATSRRHARDHSWRDQCAACPARSHTRPAPVWKDIHISTSLSACSAATHRLCAHKDARITQLSIWSSIRKWGWKYFARFNINTNAIDDGAVDLAAQHGIQFTHTGLRQINLEVMLVEWFYKGIKEKLEGD